MRADELPCVWSTSIGLVGLSNASNIIPPILALKQVQYRACVCVCIRACVLVGMHACVRACVEELSGNVPVFFSTYLFLCTVYVWCLYSVCKGCKRGHDMMVMCHTCVGAFNIYCM